jgi:NitT/TauT family transport system substrate-binding protein
MSKATIAALLGIVTMLVAGCGEPPPLPLSVGINPWVGYDPIVLAREHRYIDRDRIRVLELSSSTETLRTLRNGLLDAAALTLDEALRLADEGAAIRIVAVLNVSTGADAVVARAPINTPSQLKGKRIGVEDSAGGALVLARMMQAGRLRQNDLLLLRIEASQQEGALRGGWVDAIVTFEPMKSRLQGEGYRVIFDSRQMPDEIVSVLVVRADVLEQRFDDVVELLAGWERGVVALRDSPDHAAELFAPGVRLAPEQYLATLKSQRFTPPAESARLLGGSPAPLAERHAKLGTLLVKLGMLSRPPEWSALLSGSAAAAAAGRAEAR